MKPTQSESTIREDNAFYKLLIKKGQPLKPLKTAIVMPIDKLSLEGAIAAMEKVLIIPILIGPIDVIQKIAKEEAIDISNVEIINCMDAKSASAKAVEMVVNDGMEAIMKGHIATDILMHAVVSETRMRTERRMSHVFVVSSKNYPKPLFLSDAAVNIDPDLFTKKDIIQNAIDLFHCIELGVPKVAVLSATENVTDSIPDTIEAAALSKMADRGEITGGLVDGPLAFDNAISMEAVKIKGIKSEVAGDADILIVPDIQSGNMLYKLMRYLSGYESAGIVVGARVPIILTSRAATTPSRVASCALAAMSAHRCKIGRDSKAMSE